MDDKIRTFIHSLIVMEKASYLYIHIWTIILSCEIKSIVIHVFAMLELVQQVSFLFYCIFRFDNEIFSYFTVRCLHRHDFSVTRTLAFSKWPIYWHGKNKHIIYCRETVTVFTHFRAYKTSSRWKFSSETL